MDEPTKNLCKNMAAIIIAAGGADLVKVTACPVLVLEQIGPEQSDPQMAAIRSSLGIIGYYEGSSDL